MNDLVIIALGVVLAILVIFCIKMYPGSDSEGWYPTSTYVNTPTQMGVYPNQPNNWWGGNYYYRLNWQPWGYHRPGYYHRRGPVWDTIQSPYLLPQGPASQTGASALTPVATNALLANGTNPGAPVPRGNPVPVESIRWRGMFGPMLTSIKSPKDYYLGQWVRAGTAYTDNPNDFTYLDVYQLNLDPGRDLFSYKVVTKGGQEIPINLRQNHNRLDDGDRFQVQGMEGKGDFVFVEADKYSYVYA